MNDMESLINIPKANRPDRYEMLVVIWERAITTMVGNSFDTPDMYTDACQLIHCWVNMAFMVLESDLYPGIFEDIKRLEDTIQIFISHASTANHLYSLCDILYDKVSAK